MKSVIKNGLLLIVVVILAFSPLFLARNAEFSGADAQAEKAIITLNSDYKPWFAPLWEPPSGEVETFLFALQAAIGSGFVFYYLGYAKGKYNAEKSKKA
ncbi:MAG TPA: energy-coupling factor ABC transporter substrate-binding protein [Desulfitobacteriaceae bacterium]|nr:energy-coupling factor ABC transporter substrate-binding protein [Desulfitobacteriaceae bacterium]